MSWGMALGWAEKPPAEATLSLKPTASFALTVGMLSLPFCSWTLQVHPLALAEPCVLSLAPRVTLSRDVGKGVGHPE